MTLELALRLTEVLLGFAFIQQSVEHLCSFRNEQLIFIPRLLLSILLISGIATPLACIGLVMLGLVTLHRFQGPYNGGSDRMSLLILCCLCFAQFEPIPRWKEYIIGYLALQLVLSYFISGWVKIVNPAWRSGQALVNVFRFSAYPACEAFRNWAEYPRLLWIMSWSVILFELLFPFTLLSQPSLIIGLIIAATFHLANACLFGLNRFFWIWLTAYPSILWFQMRIMGH